MLPESIEAHAMEHTVFDTFWKRAEARIVACTEKQPLRYGRVGRLAVDSTEKQASY